MVVYWAHIYSNSTGVLTGCTFPVTHPLSSRLSKLCKLYKVWIWTLTPLVKILQCISIFFTGQGQSSFTQACPHLLPHLLHCLSQSLPPRNTELIAYCIFAFVPALPFAWNSLLTTSSAPLHSTCSFSPPSALLSGLAHSGAQHSGDTFLRRLPWHLPHALSPRLSTVSPRFCASLCIFNNCS